MQADPALLDTLRQQVEQERRRADAAERRIAAIEQVHERDRTAATEREGWLQQRIEAAEAERIAAQPPAHRRSVLERLVDWLGRAGRRPPGGTA